jgi:hypothetical protein
LSSIEEHERVSAKSSVQLHQKYSMSVISLLREKLKRAYN